MATFPGGMLAPKKPWLRSQGACSLQKAHGYVPRGHRTVKTTSANEIAGPAPNQKSRGQLGRSLLSKWVVEMASVQLPQENHQGHQ